METREQIVNAYKQRFEKLEACSNDLIEDIKNYLKDFKRIDQISGRAKSIDSFSDKAVKEITDKCTKETKRKYTDPLFEIQDQIGIRIVTYYKQDVDFISETINKYYSVAEETKKEPDDEYTFRYFGKHFILNIPQELREEYGKEFIPTVFELQIKTLFQHAWGQCEHDLNYKGEIDGESKRLIGLASANAWGADKAFDAILQIIRNRSQ